MQIIALAVVFPLFLSQKDVNAKSPEDVFLIEPYLLEVDRNSATVAFHLSNPMKARVLLSVDGDVAAFRSEEKSRSHFIKVNGLLPGQIYSYQVICGDGRVQTPAGDSTYQIRTACNKGESFTFIVFGDPRPGENRSSKYHKKVIARALQKEPAFSLVLGDMVDDGTDFDLWKDFFSTEKELLRKAAIYPVIGDNDFARGRGLVKSFFPLLERGYYHFEWGDVQFFGMNAWDTRGFQPEMELNAQSEQLQWLESQLSKKEVQDSLFRIVFLHDPVMISRGVSSEILKRLWEPVFIKYNVDIVFASWHMYERSQHNGIRYIISGGGGAELLWLNKNSNYPAQVEAKTYHFCKVDVTAGAMTISAIGVNDTILDALTISPKNNTFGNSPDLTEIAQKVRQEIAIEGGKNLPFLPIHLFSYDNCGYCRELLSSILPRLARQHRISLIVYFYDLELHETVYDLLLAAGADFGYQKSAIPTLFIGRRVLGGEQEIENNLPREFSDFQKNPDEYIRRSIVPFQDPRDTQTIKENTFDDLSAGTVFSAGLLNGVKPCSTAALVMLISFLIATGISNKTRNGGWLAFVTAIFLSCVVSGFSFFKFNLSISAGSFAANGLKWAVLSGLLFLAAVSGFDFAKAWRPGSDQANFLSSSVFWKIRDRIRLIAATRLISLPAALLAGVVFSSVQLACTGPVYISIVSLISEPAYRGKAVGFLFLYGLAFTLPIVFVYAVILLGRTSGKKLWLTPEKEKF